MAVVVVVAAQAASSVKFRSKYVMRVDAAGIGLGVSVMFFLPRTARRQSPSEEEGTGWWGWGGV